LTGGVFVAAADVLALGARLSAASELAAPDVLRRRIRTLLDQFAARAREAGASDVDVQDARYALVAFLDEQLLKAPWSGRQEWMIEPLQLTEYGENTAGEGFFARLDAISEDRRRAHVAQIYHLCLCLGFQGKYAVRGAESLSAVTEQLAAQLGPALAIGDVPSPHATPTQTGARKGRREFPLVALGTVCLVAAIALFVVLRVSIGGAATETTRGLDDTAKSVPRP
jgi:type VI secretion system protein ImpK